MATTTPDAFSLSNGLWNEFYQAYQIINGPVRAALLGDADSRSSLPPQWRPGYLRLVAWDAFHCPTPITVGFSSSIYRSSGHRQMCWYVHASGAVGLRGLGAEIFPALGGLTLRTCGTLAVAHAKLMLKYAGLWTIPYRGKNWEGVFEELKRTQAIVLHAGAFGADATNDLYLRWQRQSTRDLQTSSVAPAEPTSDE